MKILVTGGTGVVGESTVRALHARGHTVRVLTRHAGRDEAWWPVGVEGWAGDVSNEKSIRGSADGCDAILHIAGIADEQPPTRTFQAVNIDGTRYVVLEAERAGVKRVVYVSSLGADRGQSAYHKSKFVAEDVVQTFSREWVIVRPSAVYGPGDEHLSVLLRMVRTLPVIPTIGDGEQQFQPVWHEDVAEALAQSVERADVAGRVLEIAGPERTSQNDLTTRMQKVTGRSVVQAPLPELFAGWGIRALDAIGVDVGFTEEQLKMLTEGNFIQPGQPNALIDVFGVKATSLNAGLERLANEQPEQLPSEGVGTLTRKRYWVDIRGGKYDADGLFEYVRGNLPSMMPSLVTMKSDGSSGKLEEGQTLTVEIPVRGSVQVRAAEVGNRKITLLTVAGHPIAGAVRFLVEPEGDAVRFQIEVYDRPANVVDRLMLKTVGEWLQRGTWVGLAENVAKNAGGTAIDVTTTEEELSDRELDVVNEWAKALSAQLSRNTTLSGRD
jgi:uncharacterized protein YbjT (DUF2867 family)